MFFQGATFPSFRFSTILAINAMKGFYNKVGQKIKANILTNC